MKYTFIIDPFYQDETYKVGDHVLVLQKEDLNSRTEWYDISKRHAAEGYPGNLDHTVKCFHGWRGTTNNIAVTACGVYTIKSITELDDDKVKITINRKDLKKGED